LLKLACSSYDKARLQFFNGPRRREGGDFIELGLYFDKQPSGRRKSKFNATTPATSQYSPRSAALIFR
jgi:hypothetical protein